MANELTGQLLEQVNHLHTVMSVQSGKPLSVSTTIYGFDGKTEAKQIKADYKAVTFDDKGTITGGSLVYSSHAQGTKLSDSTATFGANGKPTSVASTLFDRRNVTPYRAVNADFSGLVWTNTNRIQHGEVKITTAEPNGNKPTIAGSMSYTNEQLAQIRLTHYARDGSGDIHGYTTLNYENTQFLGDEIVGGYQLMTTQRQDQSLSSQSKLFYSSDGLPTSMEVNGYAANGTDLNSQTLTDYTSIVFDACRQIYSGQLHISTKDNKGNLRSKIVTAFVNGLPQNSETQNFSVKEALLHIIKTDYTSGRFNNANHAINSTITVNTFRPDGTLVSSNHVQYDNDGNPTNHLIANYLTNGQNQVSQTEVNYAEASFDHTRKVVKGQVKTETTASDGTKTLTVRHYNGTRQYAMKETLVQSAGTGEIQTNTKTINRADGTRSEVITQSSAKSATITQYATDGKTVTKCFAIDYTNALVEGNTIVSGSVAISARDGKQRLLSTSQLNYSTDSLHTN